MSINQKVLTYISLDAVVMGEYPSAAVYLCMEPLNQLLLSPLFTRSWELRSLGESAALQSP